MAEISSIGFTKTPKITVQYIWNLLQITSDICMSADILYKLFNTSIMHMFLSQRLPYVEI